MSKVHTLSINENNKTDIQTLYKSIHSKIEFNNKEFELVAGYFQLTHINKKDVLVAEGKPNDKLYFIGFRD